MSAPARAALSIQHFLTKNYMTPVPHPLYSLDLNLSDFFLFPQLKKVLKGKYIADVEGVKQKTAGALKGFKTDEFKNCFEQWKKVSIGLLHQMEGILKVAEV